MPRGAYIFKNPKHVVRDMLYGMKTAYPGLYIDPENNIVMLNRNRKKRVGLVCGAGAGIEPFGAGFVGEGMLTAYVFGEIFEPPDVSTISKVIYNVAMLNRGGVLVLLLNYPRQVLNFGLAIEKARLKGITVESFVITDDCSRTGSSELVALEKNLALRMGLTGCSYVFKILGTMSTLGYDLYEILEVAMALNFRLATIGFSLSSCTPIGDKHNNVCIPEGEVVVGCGLLGDKGVRNIKADSLKGVVQEILPRAIEQCGLIENKNSNCCVLVNNIGQMTQMELYATANEVDLFLGGYNICIERLYAGSVMTSLNTKGVLISILNTTNVLDWLPYLDMCTEAFAWPGCRLSKVNKKLIPMEFLEEEGPSPPSEHLPGMQLANFEASIFSKCIIAACDEIIKSEDIINKLNGLTGNGDCGSNMRKFAENLKLIIKDVPLDDVSKTFSMCSALADEKMTGSIGSIYSTLFSGAASFADSWVSAWDGAINEVMKVTGAKVGNRTLLDIILPSYERFLEKILSLGESRWKEALRYAVEMAECMCCKTAEMVPSLGRAKFSEQSWTRNMDAGAYGVYVWLKAVYDTLLRETSTPEYFEAIGANIGETLNSELYQK